MFELALISPLEGLPLSVSSKSKGGGVKTLLMFVFVGRRAKSWLSFLASVFVFGEETAEIVSWIDSVAWAMALFTRESFVSSSSSSSFRNGFKTIAPFSMTRRETIKRAPKTITETQKSRYLRNGQAIK